MRRLIFRGINRLEKRIYGDMIHNLLNKGASGRPVQIFLEAVQKALLNRLGDPAVRFSLKQKIEKNGFNDFGRVLRRQAIRAHDGHSH